MCMRGVCVCVFHYYGSQQWVFMLVMSLAWCANSKLDGPGYPFLGCVITFDLSCIWDPTATRITASIAVRIIWPHKPHHYNMQIPSGGGFVFNSNTVFALVWCLRLNTANCRTFPNKVSLDIFIVTLKWKIVFQREYHALYIWNIHKITVTWIWWKLG